MHLKLGETEFLVAAHSLRMLQGMTLSTIYALCYSLTLKLFNEPNQKLVTATMAISTGTGLMMGPVIGGFLYQNFGYEMPFLFAFLFAFLPVVFTKLLVP